MDKVKVFNYPWHIAHQYSLCKLPNTQWDWLTQHRRSYSAFPRGDFFAALGGQWVPQYEAGKYDFALLHLDQQCFEDNIWERGKGSLFKDVNAVVTDIPKVCIMHGTPYYPEMFESDITDENRELRGYTKDQIGMSSVLIDRFHEVVKDIDVVIFNSRTARKQWGFGDADGKEGELTKVTNRFSNKEQYAIAIWHGLDPEEWFDLPKEPRVVTMISPGGLDMYYDRTLLRGVKEVLLERDIEHCHITVDATFNNWTEYRNFLGRSLIYFNPTRESPMPRSRTEAMLSGSCVLTTKGQDVEEFIVNDENGIIVPRNPTAIADIIEALIYDYKRARELGEKGRQTAIDKFSVAQFEESWRKIIKQISGKTI